MAQAAAPAIAVDELVKVYKTTRAVDGISFALEPGSITGLLGGNGAGKTTTIAMILGLVMPTSGTARVLGAEMPRQRYQVLHRMNFESPYVDMPHRLTVRQNLKVFGRLYAVEDLPSASRALAQRARSHRVPRPADRQALGRAEDPRRARQGADQLRPTCSCSTSRPPRSIPIPPTGCAAGSSAIASERGATVLLASHNMAEVERLCERVIIMKRGRIEDDDTPAAPARPLRPRDARGGVPRRCARTRRSPRGRAMMIEAARSDV